MNKRKSRHIIYLDRVAGEGGFMAEIGEVSLSLLGYNRSQVMKLVEEKEARIKSLESEISESMNKIQALEEKVSYFEGIEQALKDGVLDARVTGNTIVEEATNEASKIKERTTEQVIQFKEEFAYNSRELVGNGSHLKDSLKEMKQEMLDILANYQDMLKKTDFDEIYPENQIERLLLQVDAYEEDGYFDEVSMSDEPRQASPENNLSESEKRELEKLIQDVIANEKQSEVAFDIEDLDLNNKLVDFKRVKGSN